MDACALHADRPSVAVCGRCGRRTCLDCAIPVRGEVRCTGCAAEEFPAGGGYAVAMDGPREPWLRAEAFLLAAAGVFLAATFVPAWYRGGGELFGLAIPGSGHDAWGGATLVAGVAAGLAILWVVVRRLWLRGRGAAVDAALGAIGLLFTVAGLFVGRSVPNVDAGASWGFLAGIPLAVLWATASIRRLRRELRGGRAPARTSGFAA